jgi:hypothetical protein
MLPADPKLACFYRYLGQAIQADIPIDRAFANSAGPARSYCRKVVTQLDEGTELWEAIEAISPAPYKPILQQVEPGSRVQALEALASTVEQEMSYVDGLQKLLLPPLAFVVFMSLAIVLVFAPASLASQFPADSFDSWLNSTSIPLLLHVIHFCGNWWGLFIALALAGGFLLCLLFDNRIQFSTPACVEARLFALWSRLSAMGVSDSELLASFLPFLNGNKAYQEHVQRWQNAISPTRSLADEVANDPFAPALLRACFNASNPPEALQQTAALHRERYTWLAANLSVAGAWAALILAKTCVVLIAVSLFQLF